MLGGLLIWRNLEALSPGEASKTKFFVLFYEMRPLPKNSALNPMCFSLFGGGLPWGLHKALPPTPSLGKF